MRHNVAGDAQSLIAPIRAQACSRCGADAAALAVVAAAVALIEVLIVALLVHDLHPTIPARAVAGA